MVKNHYKYIYETLVTILGEEYVTINKELHTHTFTRLGGTADFFVTPNNHEQVQQLVRFVNEEYIPFTLLGNGSNLIIKDGGIRGIVMSLKEINEIKVDHTTIIAESGAKIIDVSYKALEHHLTGLEFACGIPGSVGGALYMNAGAYGGEIKDVLHSATVVDRKGNLKVLLAEDLDLAYRTSNISEKGYIVLDATFHLKEGDYASIKSVMDDLTFRRESKQPLEYPSCGSVFKRPPGYYAGKLIQDSGLQGTRVGDAEVSLKHAGFIINRGNATAKDYIELIKHVQKTVKEKFGVSLEREVKIIGEDTVEKVIIE